MINTFTTFDNAVMAISEFCEKNGQDAFIYHIKYPGGQEYCLKKRSEIMTEISDSIVWAYYLPFDHCFMENENKNEPFRISDKRVSNNAQRAADIWTIRLGIEVTLKRHYKTKNGNKVLSHYTLII